jgi:hypothetical protein
MKPPPGPFRPEFWKSPLRGLRTTAVLGWLALAFFGTSAITGFLSHAAYMPDLGANAIVPKDLPLNLGWPAGPAWLYAVTQGLHVTLGIASIPVLIAKLWSVMPRLFQFPPVASPMQAIERVSIGLFVASSVFLLATGVCNVFYFYPFDFNFVVAHYYAAVVFTASLLVHLVMKLPLILRPREHALDTLRAVAPAEPTLTRRGLVGFTLGGSALLAVGFGPVRSLAFLSPRTEAFPVNKTFRAAAITPEMVGPAYRLEIAYGDRVASFSREELMAMPMQTESLPIACVEGWSTTQSWTGIPLAKLAEMVGAIDADELLVESLQPRGVLRKATLSHQQFTADRALLALQVNGADLSRDHGYPARIIVPALPGVHNTKWVGKLVFT